MKYVLAACGRDMGFHVLCPPAGSGPLGLFWSLPLNSSFLELSAWHCMTHRANFLSPLSDSWENQAPGLFSFVNQGCTWLGRAGELGLCPALAATWWDEEKRGRDWASPWGKAKLYWGRQSFGILVGTTETQLCHNPLRQYLSQ